METESAGMKQGRIAVGDVPSNKQQHPLYPRIHFYLGNPGMHPGCTLATTTQFKRAEGGGGCMITGQARFGKCRESNVARIHMCRQKVTL